MKLGFAEAKQGPWSKGLHAVKPDTPKTQKYTRVPGNITAIVATAAGPEVGGVI
jgi:hypothetical protein